MIIAYIIVFVVLGMIMGYTLEKNTAITGIIIISILWAFVMGPWAIATFIELMLGYMIALKLRANIS